MGAKRRSHHVTLQDRLAAQPTRQDGRDFARDLLESARNVMTEHGLLEVWHSAVCGEDHELIRIRAVRKP